MVKKFPAFIEDPPHSISTGTFHYVAEVENRPCNLLLSYLSTQHQGDGQKMFLFYSVRETIGVG